MITPPTQIHIHTFTTLIDHWYAQCMWSASCGNPKWSGSCGRASWCVSLSQSLSLLSHFSDTGLGHCLSLRDQSISRHLSSRAISFPTRSTSFSCVHVPRLSSTQHYWYNIFKRTNFSSLTGTTTDVFFLLLLKKTQVLSILIIHSFIQFNPHSVTRCHTSETLLSQGTL